MPIDHTGIWVPKDKHEEAVNFYLAALKPLGYEKIIGEAGAWAGMGVNEKPDWFLMACDTAPDRQSHIAFTAPGNYVRLEDNAK